MAIELQTFASGDTDYIAKLNSNVAELTDVINGLQTQVGAVAGGDSLSVGMLMGSLFNFADALIGPLSYTPTKSASTLSIASGGMYLAGEQAVVASFNTVPLSFSGQPSATYYVQVTPSGAPVRVTEVLPGTIYSIVWTGSSFGVLTYLAPIFFDTTEASASRTSTVFAKTYANLDARLEAGETVAKEAQKDADTALGVAYEMQASLGVPVRKVGITVDGTTGTKGAIQVDFDGIIVGWSIISDVPGDIQVHVSKKMSPAPPGVPAIPNITTDKISASAPVALAGAQSAARADAGVASWTRELSKWDVLQFNVTSVSTLTRATLYLRIYELLPSPPEVNPLSEFFPPPENPFDLIPQSPEEVQ